MKISTREDQVLRMIAQEYSADEIAEELFLSVHTVISHRKNLLRKLQVKNAAGMVRRGFELGYLQLTH